MATIDSIKPVVAGSAVGKGGDDQKPWHEAEGTGGAGFLLWQGREMARL